MVDYAAHRAKLQVRISAKSKPDTADAKPQKCDHEFKRFKQTVRPDNSKFSGSAHFVVMACVRCHEKRTIDYEVIR